MVNMDPPASMVEVKPLISDSITCLYYFARRLLVLSSLLYSMAMTNTRFTMSLLEQITSTFTSSGTRSEAPKLYDWVERHYDCDCCGSTMVDAQCKVRCPNCGFLRDCTDP